MGGGAESDMVGSSWFGSGWGGSGSGGMNAVPHSYHPTAARRVHSSAPSDTPTPVGLPCPAQVKNRESVPADMVLVAAFEPEPSTWVQYVGAVRWCRACAVCARGAWVQSVSVMRVQCVREVRGCSTLVPCVCSVHEVRGCSLRLGH